jgi:hypothetical protein
LLENEGIPFDEKGRVDLTTYGWQGPDDEWLNTHNLLPPNTFDARPKQKPLL